MDTELVGRMISTLPEDDDHPYRTGPWRPQTREWDAPDVEVVSGAIPADLDGIYLRNTENPLHPAIKAYHPFDGDAMIHLIGFRDGKAFYRNRFVRTDGLLAEQKAGRSLWAGTAESPSLSTRPESWGARGGMKDPSSTDIVVHRGTALTSFYMCGDLYRMDPVTGDNLGKETFGGRFPAEGVSAHTKVDEHTGELLFFNYGRTAPYMHYGVLDADGDLAHYVDIPLPGPRMPHDMAYTENFAILGDFPLFWDPALLADGHFLPRFYQDIPTRFAVIPRRGTTEQIRWFEADPTFVLHFVNAYEDRDSIVIDGFHQSQPEPSGEGITDKWLRAYRYLSLDLMQTHLHRWRLDLMTGTVTEQRLSDSFTEFGMMNPLTTGRRHRFAYAATAVPGRFLFDGLVKHDVESGTEQRICFGEGVFGSETVMAPRVGSTGEDDGYLVTFVTDMNQDASFCFVYAAQSPSEGPLCVLRLPERISSGTHSTWVAGSEIRRWHTADEAPAAVGL